MSHPADAIYVDGVAVAKGDVRAYLGRTLATADIATDVQGQALPNCQFILAIEGGGSKVFAYDSASSATHDGDLVLVDASGRRYTRPDDLASAAIIAALGSGDVDLAKIDPGSAASIFVGRKAGASALSHMTMTEAVAEFDTHFASADWRTRDQININPAAQALPANGPGMFGSRIRVVLGTDGHIYVVGIGGPNGVVTGHNSRRLKRLGTESPVLFTKVWLGAESGFALDTDGYVWSWGKNTYGVLGHGDTTLRHIAKRIDYFPNNSITISDVVPAVSGSNTDCFAVMFIGTNGRAYYAGYNNDGEAGLGNTTQQNTPVEWGLGAVGADVSFAVVASYPTAIFVVDTSGDLFSAGDDYYGQQGQGSTSNSRSSVQSGALANVSKLVAGYTGTLALTTDGKVHYAGYNGYGQAGNGATGVDVLSFAQVTALGTDATDVALSPGAHMTCAAIIDTGSGGEVRLWGRNNAGQIGDGSTTDRDSPVDPGDIWQGGVTRVEFGGEGNAATGAIVEAGGALFATGYQSQGNASVGIVAASLSSFARVKGYSGTISDWAVFGYGGFWGLQVLCDQHVYSGGYNANGEAGVAERDDINQPVLQAMLMPAIAAKSDKVLAAYGSFTQSKVVEEELTLSGASVDSSTAKIPPNAIALGVSLRVTEAITGAASFDCGDTTTADKFGGTLGLTSGLENVGAIAPAFYASLTAIRLTANGSNFTGGKVRLALHYFEFGAPSS